MAKFGKTVDDLKQSKDGSTFYFMDGSDTYALYNQKSKGDFVELTISKTTVNEAGEKITTKVRFTEE